MAASSFAVELPALPQSELADTEVSTNFTFEVGGGSNRRLLFSLEFQSSPSNNVEVAIGCDADENVTVSFVESGFGHPRKFWKQLNRQLWYNVT